MLSNHGQPRWALVVLLRPISPLDGPAPSPAVRFCKGLESALLVAVLTDCACARRFVCHWRCSSPGPTVSRGQPRRRRHVTGMSGHHRSYTTRGCGELSDG